MMIRQQIVNQYGAARALPHGIPRPANFVSHLCRYIAKHQLVLQKAAYSRRSATGKPVARLVIRQHVKAFPQAAVYQLGVKPNMVEITVHYKNRSAAMCCGCTCLLYTSP